MNDIKKGSAEALELLKRATKLENTEASLHGSAYQPVHLAVKIMRRLANETASPQVVHAAEVALLVADLRKFSPTVGRPASDRMLEAAVALEQIAAP
jgi:hypothetical protein